MDSLHIVPIMRNIDAVFDISPNKPCNKQLRCRLFKRYHSSDVSAMTQWKLIGDMHLHIQHIPHRYIWFCFGYCTFRGIRIMHLPIFLLFSSWVRYPEIYAINRSLYDHYLYTQTMTREPCIHLCTCTVFVAWHNISLPWQNIDW